MHTCCFAIYAEGNEKGDLEPELSVKFTFSCVLVTTFDESLLFITNLVANDIIKVYYPSQMSVDKGFFQPTSQTVFFSLQFKNSGHMITSLQNSSLQNTDHVMPFWSLLQPLKVDCLTHLFPDGLCTV